MVVSESCWGKTVLFLAAKSQVSFAILLCVLCMCALYMYRVIGRGNVCQDRRLTSGVFNYITTLVLWSRDSHWTQSLSIGWTDWPASLWIKPISATLSSPVLGLQMNVATPSSSVSDRDSSSGPHTLPTQPSLQVHTLLLTYRQVNMHSKNCIVVYVWPVSQILSSPCTRYIVSLSPQYTPFLEKRFMVNATGKINYCHPMPVWQVSN